MSFEYRSQNAEMLKTQKFDQMNENLELITVVEGIGSHVALTPANFNFKCNFTSFRPLWSL